MKKFMLLALLSAFVFSVASYAGSYQSQAKKLAKAEYKRLKKEGWIVAPGALPLQAQLEDAYLKQLERGDDGYPLWYIGTGQSVGQIIDAARVQATAVSKQNIAEQAGSEIAGLVENAVGNKQLSTTEAASIAQTITKSKELINAKLGRTVPVVECYRRLKNGNVEVLIRTGYNANTARQLGIDAIKEQLEQEARELVVVFENAVK